MIVTETKTDYLSEILDFINSPEFDKEFNSNEFPYDVNNPSHQFFMQSIVFDSIGEVEARKMNSEFSYNTKEHKIVVFDSNQKDNLYLKVSFTKSYDDALALLTGVNLKDAFVSLFEKAYTESTRLLLSDEYTLEDIIDLKVPTDAISNSDIVRRLNIKTFGHLKEIHQFQKFNTVDIISEYAISHPDNTDYLSHTLIKNAHLNISMKQFTKINDNFVKSIDLSNTRYCPITNGNSIVPDNIIQGPSEYIISEYNKGANKVSNQNLAYATKALKQARLRIPNIKSFYINGKDTLLYAGVIQLSGAQIDKIILDIEDDSIGSAINNKMDLNAFGQLLVENVIPTDNCRDRLLTAIQFIDDGIKIGSLSTLAYDAQGVFKQLATI